ncbi:MAG: radical SAM protein [Oscillospiraceae bacterium]|nr:radical SAM protein [Oscillospiraceae bacterium]
MKTNSELQAHIVGGVERIVSDALRAAFRDPRETAFLLRFREASRRASKTRLALEKNGEHAPAFLIASITSRCNLHCAGCYSRCIETTTDGEPVGQLSGEEWARVFREAEELGVSFILLVGGEPLLRRDVIGAAAAMPDVLFPVFTNGTFLDEYYVNLFDEHRNLVPVLSLEGGRESTDARRGAGVYDKLLSVTDSFRERGVLYGASVTVTTENLREVTSPDYINGLAARGCRLVLFIEFVPVTEDSRRLAPGNDERRYLDEAVAALRRERDDILLLCFPGDELAMGGCMAAGREFFHINARGGAEPCPFSPYSDVNVRDRSLREALNSGLFTALRAGGLLEGEHLGGCVLYDKRAEVEKLLTGF